MGWSVLVPSVYLFQYTGGLQNSNFSSAYITGLPTAESCRVPKCTDSGFTDPLTSVMVHADTPLHHHSCAPDDLAASAPLCDRSIRLFTHT
ncbi:hypothetical protein MRX96_059783 [Rhipicephalus microplus]